ncbi:hypothetical protein J7T55_000413 [Diaporthe amygdali]|uniref:uncharacterized protein n=1 Tax=Phomopsis amygdali TaxID=1214568 RepID=UPI0022FE6BF1|nr:uncharacterized protein J7T55_000413 [Diaporthe amygdali]KAJ0109487.1 hypothetical protein J7T55_000413 [Diaporthe amygdali]
MSGSVPEVQPCQTCGVTDERRFTCIQCNNLAFCQKCWSEWVLHAPGAVGWNGKPHEKADPAVVHTLRQILEPTRTEAEHAFELLEDEDTTWFGFGRDSSGQSMFYDYGRFAAIMSELVANGSSDIYPQLVSVIGETGAGKSTLIKMLIDRQASGSADGSRYYSPVTSSNYDRTATTGDVHIYADPSSAFSTNPLLFVDCEGLNGGEAMPKQLRHHQSQDPRPAARQQTSAAPPPYDRAARAEDDYSRYVRSRHSSKRTIAWARTPQTRKREFAVSQLYPRILYTFSDVVVFVLRNPRAFESTVLDKLIRWGQRSIDASLNQPALPHAVIVLNATEDVDAREWDVTSATEMLLSDIHDAVHREPALQEHVRAWARRGRKITNTSELLACYYASVSVVRVPHKGGSYMLMDEQAGKLMELVRGRCAASHATKRQLRMLATAEKLQGYLQAAYDHFTKTLDAPFDFVREALRKFPIPRNFQGNVLSLALSIRDNSTKTVLKEDARQIFLAMGPMIASCIMLDAVRQNLLGTATRLLDDKYAKPCTAALQTFSDMYWPCSFSNPSFGDAGRCCNVRSGHNPKGHQNVQGKIIANGSYQSTLNLETFQPEWTALIRRSLEAIEGAMSKLSQAFPAKTELTTAALLHRERLNDFYRVLDADGATAFVSHSACLSCLRELPECALPCGHVLCLPCMELYGTRASRTCIEISRCPLHVGDIIAEPPWTVAVKPARAGVRVLSLDGGGIRGIVQLHVLREIERLLGPGLPIQLFFDLMVGTNTGGIIAIALGVKRWTVEATMEKFKDICREAFTPRELQSVPLIGTLSKMYHGSVFKTQPLERVLKRYFSETPFFGGSRSRHNLNTSVKVAVTAMSALNHQSVVFANYNRPDSTGKAAPYQFIRSDVPSKKLKVWEVTRATSAASPFFKPFVAPDTNTEYIDGSKSHSCPARVAHSEMRSIWSDVADLPPDIMLSIGTGRVEGEKTASDLLSRPVSRSSRSIAGTDVSSTTGSRRPHVNKSASMPIVSGQIVRSGRGGVGNYKRVDSASASLSDQASQVQTGIFVRDPKTPLLLSFAPRETTKGKAHEQVQDQAPSKSDGMYNHRKSEQAWEEFVAGRKESHTGRYSRICPEVLASQIPRFEDAQKIEELERDVERALQQEGMADIVTLAAHRLVASSLFCRFRQSSPELMALGSFLRSRCIGDFRPYFLVEDDIDGDTRQKRQIVLSGAFIMDMEQAGYFEIEPLTITTAVDKKHSATRISLSLQMASYSSGATTSTALPISGFPRRLINEENVGTAVKEVTTVPGESIGQSSVLVGEQRGAGGNASTDRVSTMSTSPSPLSADSVSPMTTYTLASRSSTGSTSFSGVGGLDKQPRRFGEDLIAELPDHGRQAAELPSE